MNVKLFNTYSFFFQIPIQKMATNFPFQPDESYFTQSKREKQEGYRIQPHTIKFQSNDSSGSDVSYDSSISSNEEKQVNKVEYFREEMSRFFINYPELLNDQIVGMESKEKNLWGDLTEDVLHEAKETSISLEAIAKRIAYYRRKNEEVDIIDLLIKEKDAILQQLEMENNMLIEENISNNKKTEDMNRGGDNGNGENVYYSWKKRRENDIIEHSRKNSKRRSHSSFNNVRPLASAKKAHSKEKSMNKKEADRNPSPKFTLLQTHEKFLSKNKSIIKNQEVTFEQKNSPTQNQGKSVLNFEPKTQLGKQLCEEIRQNNQHDPLTIKKTIINFLSKHRQSLQKDILSKSTLAQKINKLYIEDSKQLLLFYPIKKTYKETEMPLKAQTDEFLLTLKEITEGPIMKYWKLLQQKKL